MVDSLSRYLQGFRHSRWFSRRISEPSTEFLAGCVPHVSRASSCALPTFINGLVALILLVIQNIREPHMVDFQVGGAYVRLKVDFESLGRDSSKARCFPGLFGEQPRYGSKYLATKCFYTLATLLHTSRPPKPAILYSKFFCHMFDITRGPFTIHVAPTKRSTGGDFQFYLDSEALPVERFTFILEEMRSQAFWCMWVEQSQSHVWTAQRTDPTAGTQEGIWS